MRSFRILLSLVLLLAGCTAGAASAKPAGSPLKLAVATDLHYLAPSLGQGPLFEEMLENSDGKLTAYCSQLTDAFIDQCLQEKPDAVILTGDLSFSGEKKSHLELAAKLERLRQAGIQPLVIPGNHDIESSSAYNYSGTDLTYAAAITPADFRSIYARDGYDQALYEDSSSLSYVYKLSEDCWILMLDTARYEENSSIISQAGGRIREAQMDWIRTVLKEAQKQHVQVLSATHHNLITMTSDPSTYTVENASALRQLYAQYDVPVNFSGHSHAQYYSAKETDGVPLTDIMTSSMAVCCHQYGLVTFTPFQTLDYQSVPVDLQAWAKRHLSSDPFLLDFPETSKEYFMTHSVARLKGSFEGLGLDAETQQKLLKFKGLENAYVFSGRAADFADILHASELYPLIHALPDEQKSMFTDRLALYSRNAQKIEVSLKQ